MLRYLSKARIRNTRVILRVDFNVPIKRGRVLDDFDIVRTLPTIRNLLRAGNVLVVFSHHSNDHQTLRPLQPILGRSLQRPVTFLPRPLSAPARRMVKRARPGAIFLAENVRRFPGEKSNSRSLARALARLGEVFVNDAFGELHRPYASIVGIPRFLPSFAGPVVERELTMLRSFCDRPRRPLLGIVGGAKITTKLPILRKWIRSADEVLVGGAVANALLQARGFGIGRSRTDDRVAGIRSLARSTRLELPSDVVVIRCGRARTVAASSVEERDVICDIGPATVSRYRRLIRRARTLIWNGPLGLVEEPSYATGTFKIARALVGHGGRVLVGGGDTVAFLSQIGLLGKFRYVSTGGGAMLAYLAREKLPGLEALKRSRLGLPR